MEPLSTNSAVNSLSISVVCYNTPQDDLTALLESLQGAIKKLRQEYPGTRVDIYFIDNSLLNTVKFEDFHNWQDEIQSGHTNLRILHGHGNIGYGTAHNLAIHKVETNYHLILNPDVVLDSDALKRGISYLRENAKTVLLSPSATDREGNKQYLCKRYPSVLTFLIRGFAPRPMKRFFSKRLSRYEMHELSEATPGIDVPIISGCFMLCDTQAIQQLGGFDSSYFLYFEDFDISLRAASVGRLDYLPSMKIVHSGGNAAKKGLAHLKLFAKSAFRFFNTHGWQFFRQS